MPLVQEASRIVVDPRKYLTYVYGPPGVGKTSFCSQIDGHYFLSCEPGTSGVSIFGENILSWDDFLAKCGELVEALKSGFTDQRAITTIVIDSYDALWAQCAEVVMKTERFMVKGTLSMFKNVDDVEYGKAYKRVNTIVIEKIKKLKLLGFGVVLIGHQKEKEIEWNGQKVTTVRLALSDSAEQAIVKECDAVGWFTIEREIKKNERLEIVSVEKGRYAYWQPAFGRQAKHRLKNFPERLDLPLDNGWGVYEKTFREVAEKM